MSGINVLKAFILWRVGVVAAVLFLDDLRLVRVLLRV